MDDFTNLMLLPYVLNDIVISYCVSNFPDWLYTHLEKFRNESGLLWDNLPSAMDDDIYARHAELELKLYELINTKLDSKLLNEQQDDYTLPGAVNVFTTDLEHWYRNYFMYGMGSHALSDKSSFENLNSSTTMSTDSLWFRKFRLSMGFRTPAVQLKNQTKNLRLCRRPEASRYVWSNNDVEPKTNVVRSTVHCEKYPKKLRDYQRKNWKIKQNLNRSLKQPKKSYR